MSDESARETVIHQETGVDGFSNSKPKSAAVNAGWNVFFTLWTSATSLILTPWLVRRLGTDSYGILLLIWSLTGLLGIMNLGLGEATLRYVALYYAKNDLRAINRVVGSTLTIYLAVALAISSVLLVWASHVAGFFHVAPQDRPLVLTLVRLTAVVFTLGIITRTIGAIPAALQRYDLSAKINIAQSVIRFSGYALILAFGLGVLQIVLWDAVILSLVLATQVLIAKKLLPGISIWPRFSKTATRELLGYSVYSFLTYVFFTMHREAAKILTGRFLGPSGVSFIGVPDNLSQRVHSVVASAGETLLPRFSATRDGQQSASLFWNSTWLATFVTMTVFVPFTVLLPDFLRLWISAEFSTRSAYGGQLVGLSYVTQSIFVPAATLARGGGNPGIVTVVVLVSGASMLISGVALIPGFGLTGAGVAYLAASIPPAIGTVYIARRFFPESSRLSTLRAIGAPTLIGTMVFGATALVRHWIGGLTWPGFLLLASLSAAAVALLILVAEEVIGGDDSRTRALLAQVRKRIPVVKRPIQTGASS